jgi:hypothetical protein
MTKKSLFVLAPLLFGLASLLFVWFSEVITVNAVTKEDGVAENLSALFYLIAMLLGFYSILKSNRMLLPIIWTILCFIFLGEETSWFQRVFDYSVPSVEQMNAQQEFNLHNLRGLHGGSLKDSPSVFSSLFKSQNLFRIGFFSYFLIIPFLLYIPKVRTLMSRSGYYKPDSGFVLVLLLIFSLSFLMVLFSPETPRRALAETREMLYSFFIMQYVFGYVFPNKTMQLTENTAAD